MAYLYYILSFFLAMLWRGSNKSSINCKEMYPAVRADHFREGKMEKTVSFHGTSSGRYQSLVCGPEQLRTNSSSGSRTRKR